MIRVMNDQYSAVATQKHLLQARSHAAIIVRNSQQLHVAYTAKSRFSDKNP